MTDNDSFTSDVIRMLQAATVTMWAIAGGALLTGIIALAMSLTWGWVVLICAAVLVAIALGMQVAVSRRR